MGDEIELISDGDGLAVVGEKSAVERFLSERGLLALSEDLGLHKLGALAQVADSVVTLPVMSNGSRPPNPMV